MDYTELTDADRYRMLQARLKQYETRHFNATLDLEAAQATKDPGGANVETMIANLETAIAVTRNNLDAMTPPAAQTAGPHTVT